MHVETSVLPAPSFGPVVPPAAPEPSASPTTPTSEAAVPGPGTADDDTTTPAHGPGTATPDDGTSPDPDASAPAADPSLLAARPDTAEGRAAARAVVLADSRAAGLWAAVAIIVPALLWAWGQASQWGTWTPPTDPSGTVVGAMPLGFAELANDTLHITHWPLVAQGLAGLCLVATGWLAGLPGWAGHLSSGGMLYVAWSTLGAANAATERMAAGLQAYVDSDFGTTVLTDTFASTHQTGPAVATVVTVLVGLMLARRAWRLWTLREDTRPLWARVVAGGWVTVRTAIADRERDTATG